MCLSCLELNTSGYSVSLSCLGLNTSGYSVSLSCLRLNIRLIETTCGDVTLYYDADDNTLWVGSERICGIPPKTEWLGFGSGNFVDGPTAKDVLSDANGRWYRYTLAGPLSDVIVIFECDRKLPDELKSLPIWNQAVGI